MKHEETRTADDAASLNSMVNAVLFPHTMKELYYDEEPDMKFVTLKLAGRDVRKYIELLWHHRRHLISTQLKRQCFEHVRIIFDYRIISLTDK